MKKFLVDYINVIAYTITGLIFSVACFLLLLNFYHMKEVNSKYTLTSDEIKIKSDFYKDIEQVKYNINEYSIENYNGSYKKDDLYEVRNAVDNCINSFDNAEFKVIIEKEEFDYLDVYEFNSLFKDSILDDCLVRQLYVLYDSDTIELNGFDEMRPFVKDNISQLLTSNDYLEASMKNNSSYFFSSGNAKRQIFDGTRDGYYQVIRSYRNSMQLILDVSVWYNDMLGEANGKVNK